MLDGAGCLPYPCDQPEQPGTRGTYPFFAPRLTAYVIQVPVATTDGNPPGATNTITGPVYGHISTGSYRNTRRTW